MPSLSVLASAAAFAPKFTSADLMPSLSVLADLMPKFDASSLTASMARSIATDFLNVGLRYSTEDGVTAAASSMALLDFGDLHRLVRAARAAGPNAVRTDEVIQAVVTKAVYAVSAPIDSDGLLVDDGDTVSRWVGAILVRALAASGLSERDLREDAVASYFYLLVGSIVLAMLLNLPVFAALGGMLGLAAHPPAKAAAKIGRSTYKRLNN